LSEKEHAFPIARKLCETLTGNCWKDVVSFPETAPDIANFGAVAVSFRFLCFVHTFNIGYYPIPF
jgi:hypothetical protein